MGTKVNSNYESLLTFTRASKGHALRPVSYGDELVTNGTFDTDSDWTKSSTGISGGVATVTIGYRFLVQDAGLQTGKLYYISFDYTETSSSKLRVNTTGTNGAQQALLTTVSGTGSGTIQGAVVAEGPYIAIEAGSAAFTGTIDNVSVKEVTFDESDGTLTLFEHPAGIPRVEYDADGNRLGLLVEEARTNLVTRSESFDNSAWTKVEGSITADTITAPDGTSTADFFVPSTNNVGNHLVRDAINVSSAQHSWSVFAKAGGYSWIRLIHDDGDDVSHSAYFDLNNGAVGAVSGSATASITDVGNGWYRCSVTASAAASASSTQNQFIYVAEGNGDVNFAGNGTSGVYLWGAQLEVGAFPTSYIKSDSGTTTTRSADVASIPVADFGYNQSEGTVFVEAKASGDSLTFPRVISFQDDPSNRWELIGDTTLDVRIFHRSNGTTDVSSDIISNVLDGETSFKLAYAKAENDAAGSGNGGSVVTDTSNGQLNNVDTLYIGVGANGSSDFLNGHIKSIKYFPRRLTNAQLVDLTS